MTSPDPAGLTPFSKQVLRVVVVLSVLLIGVVAYGWHTGQDDANPLSAVMNPIARAATRAERLPGLRITTKTIATGPIPYSLSGTGVYNGRTGRSRNHLLLETRGHSTQLEGITSGNRSWVRSGSIAERLPAGAEWLAVPVGGGAAGGEAGASSSADAGQQLEVLSAASGGIIPVGRKTIDGIAANGYSVEFELDRLASTLHDQGADDLADAYDQIAQRVPKMDVLVWLDRRRLLRQSEVLMPIPASGGFAAGFAEVTTTYSDFGIEPKIDLPDPDRVYSLPSPSTGTSS